MKFDKLKPGMIVWDVHSTRMGNTTLRTLGTWPVQVIEVDAENRRALVSWNGNKSSWMHEGFFEKLKAERPYLVRSGMGYYRRPTREELAEYRRKQKEAGNV